VVSSIDHSIPSIDHEVLDGLREMQTEGEPDLLVELAEIFDEDASTRLRAVREALERGGMPRASSRPHTPSRAAPPTSGLEGWLIWLPA
jgi:hypothetical protein